MFRQLAYPVACEPLFESSVIFCHSIFCQISDRTKNEMTKNGRQLSYFAAHGDLVRQRRTKFRTVEPSAGVEHKMMERGSLKSICGCARQLAIGAALLATGSSVALATPPFISSIFQERTAPASAEHLALKDEHGPWLILAMTFTGDEAENQAVQLAKELRPLLNAPVYVHRKEFDHSQPLAQASTRLHYDSADTLYTKRVRHANASHDQTYAVLVGNFTSTDDPRIKDMLQKVKTAHPACLGNPNEKPTKEDVATKDSNWLIATKRAMLWQKSERSAKKGKMGAAFVTRNPYLPDDYFQNAVDDFVVDLNSRIDPPQQSLLNCKKRYTVRVATFTGQVVTKLAGGISAAGSDEALSDSLNEAAGNAHDMAAVLRAQGVEAFEFHDRNASYVTIGAFDTLGEEAPNGGPFIYNPEMVSIMNQYCGYTTRTFTDGKTGKTTQTPMCKTLKIGQDKKDPTIEVRVPFDVEGKFISIPKASTSKLYQGSLLGKSRIRE